MTNQLRDDFVSGKLKKPRWSQYLQFSEEDLMERLNQGGMSSSQDTWNAEKEIIAMAIAEKSRHRRYWYDAGLMIISIVSALAACISAMAAYISIGSC